MPFVGWDDFDDVRRALEDPRHDRAGAGRAGTLPRMDAPADLNLPPGFTARPVTPDDLDAVLALVRACEAHDDGVGRARPRGPRGGLEPPGDGPARPMTLAVFEGDVMVAEAEVFKAPRAR